MVSTMAESENERDNSEWKTWSSDALDVPYPASWKVFEDDSDDGGLLTLSCTYGSLSRYMIGLTLSPLSAFTGVDDMVEQMSTQKGWVLEGAVIDSAETSAIGKAMLVRVSFRYPDTGAKGILNCFCFGDNMEGVIFMGSEDAFEDYGEEIEELLNRIKLKDDSVPNFSLKGTNSGDMDDDQTPNGEQAHQEPQALTVSQKNAVVKAKSYLAYSAFSHDGLVEQLEYEKFTHEEAVHGADSCGADWNEQAVKKAKDYLSYSSFSRDGLIDQLVYEGFTYDQAAYGATAVGL